MEVPSLSTSLKKGLVLVICKSPLVAIAPLVIAVPLTLPAVEMVDLGVGNGGRSVYVSVEDGPIKDHRAGDGASVSSTDNCASANRLYGNKSRAVPHLKYWVGGSGIKPRLTFAVARLTASTRRYVWCCGANVNGADFYRVTIAVLKEQAR